MPSKKASVPANDQPSVTPFENDNIHTHGKNKVKSATNQNVNQSHLTQQGNETKGNTSGGNFDEVRHNQSNKPRSNPQGNSPMSVDKSQKGPGKKAN